MISISLANSSIEMILSLLRSETGSEIELLIEAATAMNALVLFMTAGGIGGGGKPSLASEFVFSSFWYWLTLGGLGGGVGPKWRASVGGFGGGGPCGGPCGGSG